MVDRTTTSTRVDGRGRAFELALLAGLAGVYITNSLVAWLQPDDFVDMTRRSILLDRSPVRPGRWLAWMIGINDLTVGVLLAFSIRIRRWRPFLFAWSGTWLLAVTAVKVTSLDALAH